jgi:hypothetical protein
MSSIWWRAAASAGATTAESANSIGRRRDGAIGAIASGAAAEEGENVTIATNTPKSPLSLWTAADSISTTANAAVSSNASTTFTEGVPFVCHLSSDEEKENIGELLQNDHPPTEQPKKCLHGGRGGGMDAPRHRYQPGVRPFSDEKRSTCDVGSGDNSFWSLPDDIDESEVETK